MDAQTDEQTDRLRTLGLCLPIWSGKGIESKHWAADYMFLNNLKEQKPIYNNNNNNNQYIYK